MELVRRSFPTGDPLRGHRFLFDTGPDEPWHEAGRDGLPCRAHGDELAGDVCPSGELEV